MTIRIVLPDGDGVKIPNGTKVYTDSGHQIKGITRIEIEPLIMDTAITAKITVLVSEIENLQGIEGIIFAESMEPAEG
jgi:hypothetical protein